MIVLSNKSSVVRVPASALSQLRGPWLKNFENPCTRTECKVCLHMGLNINMLESCYCVFSDVNLIFGSVLCLLFPHLR